MKNPDQSSLRTVCVVAGQTTIGLDIGDKFTHFCILDTEGALIAEGRFRSTPDVVKEQFEGVPRCRIALEVGTHSRWMSSILEGLAHEVIVANARKVRLIKESDNKTDKMDARTLARLARVDPSLLSPISHRSQKIYPDLAKPEGQKFASCAPGQS
ncbi:MAG: IS110 family transposase [Bryobacteraceae bacterium]